MAFGDSSYGETSVRLNREWTQLGKKLRSEYDIKLIIVMSAHYMRKDFSIVSNPKPETIHDHVIFSKNTLTTISPFKGFEEYMHFRYPAQNDVKLAKTICEDINKSKIKCVMDDSWGYDHGYLYIL